MVFAILYCLQHKYRFILYSGNSQFKIEKGWEDFFEPFVEEVDSSFQKRFNKRLIAKKLKPQHYPQWYAYKLFNKNTYLTYELFYSFHNDDFYKSHFDIPELGLKGNLREVWGDIVKMIYRYNAATIAEIQANIAQLNLPEKYVSIHIRRGDKDTEHEFVSTDDYITKLRDLTPLKEVFIYTDDYTVIEYLQKQYPDIHFFTLVNPDERGYRHAEFMKASREKKRTDLIKLFTAMQVMMEGEFTIGTYSANPGLFIGMTLPPDKFVSMQNANW